MTQTVTVRVHSAGDVVPSYFADVSQAADHVARSWLPAAETECPGAVLVDVVEDDDGGLVVRANIPDERAAHDVVAVVERISRGDLGFAHGPVEVIQVDPVKPFRS